MTRFVNSFVRLYEHRVTLVDVLKGRGVIEFQTARTSSRQVVTARTDITDLKNEKKKKIRLILIITGRYIIIEIEMQYLRKIINTHHQAITRAKKIVFITRIIRVKLKIRLKNMKSITFVIRIDKENTNVRIVMVILFYFQYFRVVYNSLFNFS